MKKKTATAAKKATKKAPASKKVTKPAKAAKVAAPAKKTNGKFDLNKFVMKSLDDDKAKDIVSIDLKGKTAIADYMVVATGTSSRHVVSMAQNLREHLKAEHKITVRFEGTDNGDWVIVDAGDIIIHLFRDEVRQFYNLEKLWGSDFSQINYMRYQSV